MPPRHRRPALALLLFALLVLLAALPLRAAAAALEAFSLPYNDASTGLTDFSSWQAPITTTGGRLAVSADAHYSFGGQRVRLMGVNVTGASAFPSHALADIHATRLARFGFNAVRFHHMDAAWDPWQVLIDYPKGNSRSLSPDRLERLHYFVARLADHGVFSNINLLVSRELKAADGVGAEVAQLGWKDQQILGFFHEGVLALHKEFATQLLSAPNPHRGGKTLAQDPAVAIVEVMNENGLVQKWYEGVLDTLPATYSTTLRDTWNAWLRTRYSDTTALLSAWGAQVVPLGAEKLSNPSFLSGSTGWNLEQHNGAAATATVTTDFNGQPALRLAVTTPSATGWYLQFNQANLSLAQGQLYTVSFWARASVAGAPLTVVVGRAHTDYAWLSQALAPKLTTGWQQFQFTFQSAVTEANARLDFTDFGFSSNTLWIAGVSVRTGGSVGGLPSGSSLEAGNVPNTLRNPSDNAPTLGQRSDWLRFCFGLERSYWTTMQAHIRDTLGFGGLVWGTIISNSPPNSQSGFDAMDSHAYWQHPSFEAGYDWDAVRWTLNNVSMVNSPDSNTLTGISRQRVKGYPHNVTEYQHPSPNSYSAEGPLLAGALGALQDWDSFWMFEYVPGTAEHVTGFFDQSGHPGKMLNSLVAAALFRRGDLRAARREYTLAQTPERELQSALTVGGAWGIADGSHLGMPGALANESRLSLSIGASATGLAAAPAAPAAPVYAGDTGQLRWDLSVADKGVVTVDTERTKMLVGFPNGRNFDFSGVLVRPGATRLGWLSLSLVLVEGAGFSHASGGRILVVATGDQENTGQVWKDASHNSVGSNWGRAPVLVERIQASVRLPVPPSRVSAWALDSRGQRGTPLAVTDEGGAALLELGASGTTLWYEVLIAPQAPGMAPSFSSEPLGQVAGPGARVVLRCAADGHPAPSLQWYRGTQSLSGQTASSLVLPSLSAADEGDYSVVATNDTGTLRSRSAGVRLSATAAADTEGSLVNISTRADVGTGFENMVMGFYTEGQRELLVRAIGPKLAADFHVPGVLADPIVDLDPAGGGTRLASNDNWDSSDPAFATAFTLTGAFPLQGSPLESCLLRAFPAAGYTATVRGAAEGVGNCLVEAYDTGRGPAGRLLNVSTRALCGAGGSAVSLGFSVTGNSPRLFLIRGIGPALVPFGIASPVSDPVITLYDVSGGTVRRLLENDDWEDYGAGPSLSAAFTGTGAFGLPSMGRDAALLVWLEPGLYSAVISSKSGRAVGLVEVYEVR